MSLQPRQGEVFPAIHGNMELLASGDSGGMDRDPPRKNNTAEGLRLASTQMYLHVYHTFLKGEKEKAIGLLPSLDELDPKKEKAPKVLSFKASQ
jgi:hypothetical protein